MDSLFFQRFRSAPITSPSPPVFIKGAHSEAANTTFIAAPPLSSIKLLPLFLLQ